MIEGVTIRDLIVREDERGWLTELLSVNLGDEDLCHVYLAMCRPGVVKGWHSHLIQSDRFVCIEGTAKIGLADIRGPVRDDEVGMVQEWGEWSYLAGEWHHRAHPDGDFDFVWPCDREWYQCFGGISKTYGAQEGIILSSERPQLLTIPPGVAHGQMALGGQRSVILNAPTHPYDRAHPDELRIPATAFGFQWEVQSR